jgi:hypothetical protein
MIKFFTTPPKPYPYILINVRNPDFRFLYYAKEVIIDSGVEMFRDPSVKDYPEDWERRLVNLYYKVKTLTKATVWVTVPDYPDDYHHKALWLNENYTNIERTLDNVLYYTAKYPNVNWLIPIQGHNKKPDSIVRSITLYREYGIIDKFSYYAVANLCVEPIVEIIYRTVKLAREKLPDKKLHVFGLKLNALKHIITMIDSFDSIAWTRPVNNRVVNYGKRHSAKSMQERIRFFEEWLRRLEAIARKNATIDQYIKHE